MNTSEPTSSSSEISIQEQRQSGPKAASQDLNTLMFRFAGVVGFCLVIVGSFLPFCQFPVAGQASWFGGGQGTGSVAVIFAGFGILCYAMRLVHIPIVISLCAGFLFFLDVLTTYDKIAIANNVTGDLSAPFRYVFDIFRDAFRIGNGAFFIFVGLSLAFWAGVFVLFSDVIETVPPTERSSDTR
jgi:hypothetical protein